MANGFNNAFMQFLNGGVEPGNALLDSTQRGGIDLDSVYSGIELFDKTKPNLIGRLDMWPRFREDMLQLGFPGQWLPENFQSVEDLNQFIAHADQVNGRLKLKYAGGDYPIWKRSELPNEPSKRGVYNPWTEFLSLTKLAYKMGIAPPASSSPQDIQKFKTQISPEIEQEMGGFRPGVDGKKWGGTWEI